MCLLHQGGFETWFETRPYRLTTRCAPSETRKPSESGEEADTNRVPRAEIIGETDLPARPRITECLAARKIFYGFDSFP